MSFLTEPQIQNAHIQITLAWVWLKDIMEQCQKNSIMQSLKYKAMNRVLKVKPRLYSHFDFKIIHWVN